MRRAQLALVGPLLAAFAGAEILRTTHARAATALSLAGWVLFLLFGLAWAWERGGWRDGLRTLGRLAVLTPVAFGVLYLYYVRSRTLEAGVHVDAVYTYVGLEWVFEWPTPLTYAGRTFSYYQFPMMLLSHLPAMAVGFGRVGAFALHFGLMVQIAFLLALATRVLARTSLLVEAAIVALVAGVVSNRLLVQSYDVAGYAIPAIALGLMLPIVADDETVPRPERLVGGLLALAMLHYYTGFFVVLPLVLAWVVLQRRPLASLRRFVQQNAPVAVVLMVLTITLTVHPELLLLRVRDVTNPGEADWLTRVSAQFHRNLEYLPLFRREWVSFFFVKSPYSWHLVDAAALGGLLVPLTAGAYATSFVTLRGRRMRYLLLCLGFFAGCLALSIVQRLLTDFQDYRDLAFLFAIFVGGSSFVFRIPRVRGAVRWLACAYGVAFAVYNYVDLAALHGKVHGMADFSYRSVQTMEGVRRLTSASGFADLRVERVYVVVEPFFALERLYLPDFVARGVRIILVRSDRFCADPAEVLKEAERGGCRPFVFASHAGYCGPRPEPERPREGVQALLGEASCDRPDAERVVRPVDLDHPADGRLPTATPAQ
ncbi:MAG TPA: hypothetical protein VKA21_01355 [Candidatus Binatia bacterium]|nr:hypothetical protein [Candidatus Binatia bacterium]